MELSHLYFELLGVEKDELNNSKLEEEKVRVNVFQCKDCLTVYNKTFGDITQNIMPETLFDDLPETYTCSICEAPKQSFEKRIIIKSLA